MGILGSVLPAPIDSYLFIGRGQAGVESPLISENDQVLGWLAMYDVGFTSYPLPLRLLIFRPGKPLREFVGDSRGIFEWHLMDGGKQVAFYQDFAHGPSMAHFELRDIETGKLIDQWDGSNGLKTPMPKWVSLFDVNNPGS